jgi:hypothetical protein
MIGGSHADGVASRLDAPTKNSIAKTRRAVGKSYDPRDMKVVDEINARK